MSVDRKQPTGDCRQETRDKTVDRRRATSDRRRETEDWRWCQLSWAKQFCSVVLHTIKKNFANLVVLASCPTIHICLLFIISFLIPLRSMGSKTPMLPVPKRQSVVFFHVHVHTVLFYPKKSTVLIEFHYVVEIGVFCHHRTVCSTYCKCIYF